MKHKTLFRLALKAIGIWLIASGLTEAFDRIGWLIDPVYGWNSLREFWFGVPAPLFRVALGAYLFFGGRWIANLAIPSNRPYCNECGYELTGSPSEGRCPECGAPFRRD